jgi:regulator of protease activity HflC (stomatin/prohibitin superfamily)
MSLIYTVPQNHVVLITRFGKHARVQRDGLRFKLPFIEHIKFVREWGNDANKYGYQIELSEQQTDTPSRQCQTIDNVTIEANASIYWRIVNPVKAVYDVDILPKAVSDVALNALRANIGKLKLDQVLSERQKLNEKIAAQLSATASKWGILFTRVEIQEINYSSETAEAMMQEMAAERKKRALIAEADGQAAAEVARANADANAIMIRAKAQAEALKLIAEAENIYISKIKEGSNTEVAGQIMLAQKYLDGMNIITKNESDKVFLPNSFQGMFNIPTNGNR